jgi:RNA polymerase subunit RPABC4/transcription elongation factor Spt4
MGAGMAGMISQSMAQAQQQAQQGQGGTTTQPNQAQGNVGPTPSNATLTCYNCNAQIPANTKFCPECGADQQAKVCGNCQTSNMPNAKFCSNCGNAL